MRDFISAFLSRWLTWKIAMRLRLNRLPLPIARIIMALGYRRPSLYVIMTKDQMLLWLMEELAELRVASSCDPLFINVGHQSARDETLDVYACIHYLYYVGVTYDEIMALDLLPSLDLCKCPDPSDYRAWTNKQVCRLRVPLTYNQVLSVWVDLTVRPRSIKSTTI